MIRYSIARVTGFNAWVYLVTYLLFVMATPTLFRWPCLYLPPYLFADSHVLDMSLSFTLLLLYILCIHVNIELWNLTSNSTYRTIDITWSATFSMEVYGARGLRITAREESSCTNRRSLPPLWTTWTRQTNVTRRHRTTTKPGFSSLPHCGTVTFYL